MSEVHELLFRLKTGATQHTLSLVCFDFHLSVLNGTWKKWNIGEPSVVSPSKVTISHFSLRDGNAGGVSVALLVWTCPRPASVCTMKELRSLRVPWSASAWLDISIFLCHIGRDILQFYLEKGVNGNGIRHIKTSVADWRVVALRTDIANEDTSWRYSSVHIVFVSFVLFHGSYDPTKKTKMEKWSTAHFQVRRWCLQ